MKKQKNKKEKRNKRIQRDFFRKNYTKSWEYLKECKNYVYAIIIIFIIFALIGFFVPASESIVETILKFIKELVEKTEGMSFIELFNFIFINNLKVSFTGMAAGIFFGIFPIIEAVGNGYLFGFVVLNVISLDGAFSLWKLFPHGIFELPAVFISLGLGLRLGFYLFQSKEKRKKRNLKQNIIESLRLFVFIIIPLLIVAALIESSLIFWLR